MKIKIKKKTQKKKRIFYLHYYFTRIIISQVSKICSYLAMYKSYYECTTKATKSKKKKNKRHKNPKKKITIKNLIAVLVKQIIF